MSKYLLPQIENIKKYKKLGNLLTVYIEVSSGEGTPINCLDNLSNIGAEFPFIFESLDNSSNTSRYTIIGFNPIKTFLFNSNNTCIITDTLNNTEYNKNFTNPLDVLREESKHFKIVKNSKLPPLVGGFVGYIGYDNIFSMYGIQRHENINQDYPYGFFGIYKNFIVFDNYKQGKMQLLTNISIENINQEDFIIKRNNAEKELFSILSIISKSTKSTPLILSNNTSYDVLTESNMSDESFKSILKDLKQNLQVGDVFQTIISETFNFDLSKVKNGKKITAIDIYKGLRHVNPSSYMFYFNLKEFQLIGSVPETYVRINNKDVLTKPLAGTRGVGKNIKEFRKLKHELETDQKEKAEHSMLIDLIRNDLAKNCEPGSIKVKKKMYIKRYNHVMHIVSDVIGKISKNKDYFDIFEGIFPHGNVTGAPKIKAMKLINDYELTNRGIYGGAIGYFGFNGNADFAVIIRTIIKKQNLLLNQVGSGIVYNFSVEDEVKEHKNKNKTFTELIKLLIHNFN